MVGDSFASPVVLTGTSGTAGIDNTGASYETGEPANSQGADGAVSVWYEWTLPANDGLGWTGVTLDTAATPAQSGGRQFDSTIEVFTGSTLTGLTLLDGNDDIDYPTTLQSSVTISGTLADGTVLRVRVDGWSDYDPATMTGTVANGVLTYSATPAPPDPPTITSATFSGTRVLAGETTFDVIGTGFDTLTQVTFGDLNVPVPYAVIDSTHMTVGPLPARIGSNGHITAINAGGSGVSAATWFVYYPGPWTTPPPVNGTEEAFAARVFRTATPFPEATTEPDFTGDPVYATSSKFNSLNAETVDADTGVAKWNQSTTMLLIDATPTPFNMPTLSYDPGDGTVADQENASDTGSIVEDADPTIDISTRLSESYYVDSIDNKSTDRADYDIWMQQLEYRRWPDSASLPSDLPAGLAGLPLFAVRDLFETTIAINLLSNGGTDNYASVNGESSGPDYDFVGDHYVVPWVDWDTGHQISWMVCYSSLTTGPAIDPPVVTPGQALGNAITDKNVNHWLAARVRFTYQPPDYRLIYFDPQAVDTGWVVGHVAMT